MADTNTPERLPIPFDVEEAARSRMADALQFADIVEDFHITDDATAQLAGRQLRAMSAFVKETNFQRLGFTRPVDALKNDIMAAFNEPMHKAATAETALRKELSRWTTEQQRIAAEALRKEQVRLEAERRQAAADLAAEQARRDALVSKAAIAKADARIEQAAAAVEEVQVAAAVVPQAAKIEGFSMRDNWQPEYEHGGLAKLVAAAAADPGLLMYLQYNTVQVGTVVKAMKANTNIPGVRAVNNRTTSVR